MRRGMIAALAAAAMMLVPVSDASARFGGEEFVVDAQVTSVTGPAEADVRYTPDGKWQIFKNKVVTAAGTGSIGMADYDASIDATLRGMLSSPYPTRGFELARFELSLVGDEEITCSGVFGLVRYPFDTPIPYREEGKFWARCDGMRVSGDLVAEFRPAEPDTIPFFLRLEGTAR